MIEIVMKLYDRDYTKLTPDEEAEWQALHQREMRGDMKFKKSVSICDYSKAVRHFKHLFPNNYLDICELQDEKRLRSQLEDFQHLIDTDDVNERKILNFINKNRAYFIIASILKKYFHFGHHSAFLFKEFQLGNSYQADYVLVGRSSDGWEFVFVELEAPVGKITTKNGDFGEAFRKGIRQVHDWDTWIERSYGSLRETFDKYRRSDMSLPEEFCILDKSRIHYVVVAGRRTDFKEETYRIRRKNIKQGSVQILHYDNLTDTAEDLIGQPTY